MTRTSKASGSRKEGCKGDTELCSRRGSTGRISRDELWMDLAISLSKRSTCARAKVGAVLVQGNRVIGTGYNGTPSGVTHCIDRGYCVLDHYNRCLLAIHAEANAILSKLSPQAPGNRVLYCTHYPCHNCIKLAVGAGVSRIVYLIHKYDRYTAKIAEYYNEYKEVIQVERFTPRTYPYKEFSVPVVLTEQGSKAHMPHGRRKAKPTKANARRGGSR